jgi:hypothetical protein
MHKAFWVKHNLFDNFCRLLGTLSSADWDVLGLSKEAVT